MIDSVKLIPIKVIKFLLPGYKIPNRSPWEQIAGPVSLSVGDFSSEALSGKSAPDFPLRISGVIGQRGEKTGNSIQIGGPFGNTGMNDHRLSKPAS